MLAKSIMVDDKEHCIFCFSDHIEEHHIFFGIADRPFSKRYGLVVPLCNHHHTGGPDSPHKNRIVDLALKCWAQTVYEQRLGDRDRFRREFRKSYL